MRSFIGFLLGGIVGFVLVPVILALQGTPSDDIGAGAGLMAVLMAMFGAISGAIIGGFSRRRT